MSDAFEIVEVAGEVYRLRFKVGPVREVQKLTGKSFGALFAQAAAFDLDALVHLLFAAAKFGRERFSLKDAEALLEGLLEGGQDLADVAALLDRAAVASGFWRGGEGTDENPTTPATDAG